MGLRYEEFEDQVLYRDGYFTLESVEFKDNQKYDALGCKMCFLSTWGLLMTMGRNE